VAIESLCRYACRACSRRPHMRTPSSTDECDYCCASCCAVHSIPVSCTPRICSLRGGITFDGAPAGFWATPAAAAAERAAKPARMSSRCRRAFSPLLFRPALGAPATALFRLQRARRQKQALFQRQLKAQAGIDERHPDDREAARRRNMWTRQATQQHARGGRADMYFTGCTLIETLKSQICSCCA